MVDLNRKNTCCLAKIEFDDPSELVMIAVGELWINSSEGSSNSIFARQQVFLRLSSTILTSQDYAYSGLKNWGPFCIESFCCTLAL